MSSNYEQEKAAQKEESRILKERGDVAEAFYNFFVANRSEGLIANEANKQILRLSLGNTPITLQTLQDAFDHTSVRRELCFVRPDVEREQLVDYIISARKMQPQTAVEERKRLMDPLLTDIETVRVVYDRVKNRRELESKSIEELREIVKPEPVSQWKPIPHIYQNRSMLLDLASRDVKGFRELMRRSGSDAINVILRQVEKD
jgi:hypothetical protein